MNRKFTIAAVVVVLLVVVALGIFAYILNLRSSAIGPNAQAYADLMRTNQPFAQAEQLRKSGSLEDAEAKYSAALQETSDPEAQARIRIQSKSVSAALGKYEKAIADLKQAAADLGSQPIMRTYAIEEMARMYQQYGDEQITQAIFSTEPYKGMVVDGDVSTTYRHLYEYAANIYPIALSELYVADWYADDLESMGTTTSNTAKRDEDLKNIQMRATAADADINGRLKHDPVKKGEYLSALTQRAHLVARMSLLGYTSYGDPEQTFIDVLAAYATKNNTKDGRVRVQYALYVGKKFGAQRTNDVHSILSPIYKEPDSHGYNVVPFLKNMITAESDQFPFIDKNDIALLASLDPDFKSFLRSLGWSEKDLALTH